MSYKNIIVSACFIAISLHAMDQQSVVNDDTHDMSERLHAFVSSKSKNVAFLKAAQERGKLSALSLVTGSNPTLLTKTSLGQDIGVWGDYLPNNSALLVSLKDTIGIFDPITLKQKHSLKQQPSEIKASPDNKEIALSAYPMSVARYDIEHGKIIAKLVETWGDNMQYNNDGSQLLIGSANSVYDTKSNQKVVTIPAGILYGAQWNPSDNTKIATTADGTSINILDTRAQKYIATIAAPVTVGSLRFTNSGNQFVITAAQQFMACNGITAEPQAYYDINGNKSPDNQPLPVPANPIFADYFVSIVPEPGAQGRDIVIAPLNDADSTIIGFDLAQNSPLFNLPNAGPQINGIMIPSPDGTKMSEIQIMNPQLQLWDISRITNPPTATISGCGVQ